MKDSAVRTLARRAGIAVQWTDYANKQHRVPVDSIRRILDALGLPCDTAHDLSHSRRLVEAVRTPSLITAVAGKPIDMPLPASLEPPLALLVREDGASTELGLRRTAHCFSVPALRNIGYHTLEIGQRRIALAVAPPRCWTIEDIAPGERLAGLAAQAYGLRSIGDCGVGDMAGVKALANAAASIGVDALALSPAHALFTADHRHFSPYSPSSRLFYNPLLADASSVLGEARVAAARTGAALGASVRELEASPLIDWPNCGNAKITVLRRLFDDFAATDLATAQTTGPAADFRKFLADGGMALKQHALFEALHAAQIHAIPPAWHWRDWPPELRDPDTPEVRSFADKKQREVLFHIFLQWLADRSFAAAQVQATRAGLRIGVIADLAIGTHGGGSDAWANQNDFLTGLEIGAPPDGFNASGQNWGLTTFSPRALSENGFRPFIATIRAAMRHAGGVRIDHAMGLMRLWVIPTGGKANEGAYLSYPLDDLLRLTALESHRHRAVVIGEDLGTVPAGFRNRLARAAISGMSVLWFERKGKTYAAPPDWRSEAVAMTSTHDLPTVAGWWRGSDLEVRARCGLLADPAGEQAARTRERIALWRAFRSAKVAKGDLPTPYAGSRLADAAVKYIAGTPARLALLPLEDAFASTDQPNLPAPIDEHPNWRRRYPGAAGALLDARNVCRRVEVLTRRELL